jgi:YbbR domain-containing protein
MERFVEQLKETLTANLGTKLVSLLVAVILWGVVLGSRNIEVSKEVPLEILTPPDLVVANEMPERLTFRLSGPKAFLRSVLDRREEPIRVNLIGNKPGLVTYRFFSDHIRLPIGVRVLSVNPASILIKLEELKKRDVPVKVITEGTLAPGLSIKSIKTVPEVVTIKGPESRIEGITEVPSVPVQLGEISSSIERELPLDLARLGVQLEGSLPKVRLDIEGHGANFKIKNIEIRVLSQYRAKLDPPVVSALVHASPAELKKLNRSKVYAIINAEGRERGTFSVSPTVVLPPTVTVVRTVPEQVNLTLY